MSRLSRFKLSGTAVLVVLLVIVILQNMDTVNTRILFITVSMPRAVLLAVSVLIGFALGLVVAGRRRRKRETPST